MGIWDYISSTGDSLKRKTPDLAAVRGLCWSSYSYTLAAVTKIDTTNLAKNATIYACREGLKTIPGGTSVFNIVYQSLRDEKFASNDRVGIKELQAKVSKLEKEIKEISKCAKSIEQAEIHEPCLEILQSRNKPEDVIKIFMMHEFVGKHILDDLIVPGVRTKDPK